MRAFLVWCPTARARNGASARAMFLFLQTEVLSVLSLLA